MKLLKNINQILTLSSAHDKDGRNLMPEDSGIINNGIVIFDEKIEFVGKEVPKELEDKITEEHDLKDHVLAPEIVDSHTHLIFGGNRSFEYSMRLNGADYQEIASSGGGILESSRGTNSSSDEELLELSRERIKRLNSYGVGTIEVKSGYGLGFKEELRLSKLIDVLKKEFAPNIIIKNTHMAAHAVPKNFSSSSEYISQVCLPLLKELNKLKIIDAVDIFHEDGYFDQNDVRSLFELANSLGIPVKSHADEFKDNDGAALAVEFGALSTDHLLCTSDRGIEKLSNSETVATLLPGTGFFLGKPQANARKFLDKGVKVAIGSDYNPGSCHFDNVLQIAAMAAPTYKMNITELWASITLNAANALGVQNQGAIKVGLLPRFSLFQVKTIDEITYNWGRNFSKGIDFI